MNLNYSIGYIIGIILLLTVFKAKLIGDIGEIAVILKLRTLDKDKYRVLSNIKLENPNASTKISQIDHVIVSTYGIFCIETKAYKGKIYGEEFSEKWCQHLYKEKNYFLNPVFQNYGHIKALENLLKDYYQDIPYYSIIVFSGDADISAIKSKKARVCQIKDVANLVKSLSVDEVFNNEIFEKIIDLIINSESKQSDFAHIIDIKKLKKTKEEKIKNMICPRCGGQLLERNGKYGKFWGCSNFPKCKFVVKNINK